MEQALFDLGIYVTKADDDEVWALCPMHELYTGKPDSSPSWSVNRNTGQHNCFSCEYKGTFAGLVVDVLDVSMWDALRWVRNYGLNMDRIESLPEYTERKEGKRSQAKEITEEDLAQFSNPPPEVLAARELTVEAAEYYGILWDASRTEWILPVRMPDGRLLGWQRKGEKRLDASNTRVKNYPRHMMKSLTLFGADVFPIGEPAVVQESPLDCARMLSAGVLGAVSTFGDKFSDEQIRVLRDLTSEVIWGHDNDEAGQASSRRFRDDGYARRFYSRFLNYEMLPPGMKDVGGDAVGDVADVHILRAVRSANHPLFADLGEAPSGIQRGITPVPGTSQKGNGRARPGAGAVRTGDRKKSYGNRRSRGAGHRIR